MFFSAASGPNFHSRFPVSVIHFSIKPFLHVFLWCELKISMVFPIQLAFIQKPRVREQHNTVYHYNRTWSFNNIAYVLEAC